jgi:hypothetical protein
MQSMITPPTAPPNTARRLVNLSVAVSGNRLQLVAVSCPDNVNGGCSTCLYQGLGDYAERCPHLVALDHQSANGILLLACAHPAAVAAIPQPSL